MIFNKERDEDLRAEMEAVAQDWREREIEPGWRFGEALAEFKGASPSERLKVMACVLVAAHAAAADPEITDQITKAKRLRALRNWAREADRIMTGLPKRFEKASIKGMMIGGAILAATLTAMYIAYAGAHFAEKALGVDERYNPLVAPLSQLENSIVGLFK